MPGPNGMRPIDGTWVWAPSTVWLDTSSDANWNPHGIRCVQRY